MGISQSQINNNIGSKPIVPLLDISSDNTCTCGKSTNSCDCITCTKCGALFKSFNNNQTICKKCLLVMEVL